VSGVKKIHARARCARCALLFMGAFFVLALGGCATYQPPELPANQLASIGIDPNAYRLRFLSVDGVYLSAIGGLNSFSGRDVLKVLPGKRAIQIQSSEVVGTTLREGGVLLVFDAQAGKQYSVRERRDGSRFYVWLATDNGQSVPLLNTP
jgi:hypothetical protein